MFADLTIPDNFWVGAAGSGIFGLIGLFLLIVGMVIGYKVFDRLLPDLHFTDELKKGNIAVAIVVSVTMLALIGGIAYIAANVIH
jgi:hypothetical protein